MEREEQQHTPFSIRINQNGSMRYHDEIGFVLREETFPGVWETRCEIHHASGDVLQRNARLDDSQSINPDLDFTTQISIVYDSFITQNMFCLSWVKWMGRKWKVSKIEVRPPRLILTLGKEYIEVEDHD